MTRDTFADFGRLYRAALAERDPQKKQLLLSEVQRVISHSQKDEPVSVAKFGPQSVSSSKITATA